jgi:hypothetical protein
MAVAEVVKNQLDREWVPSHDYVHLRVQSLETTHKGGFLQYRERVSEFFVERRCMFWNYKAFAVLPSSSGCGKVAVHENGPLSFCFLESPGGRGSMKRFA